MKTITTTLIAITIAFAAPLAQAKGKGAKSGGLQGTTHTGHSFPSKAPKGAQ